MLRKDRDKASLLLSILTADSSEIPAEYIEKLEFDGFTSRHCAFYRNDIFISVISDEKYSKNTFKAYFYYESNWVNLKNISTEAHLYDYWKILGFREYERNPKHGKRQYIRKGGMTVGVAPKTDALGQALLNHAIEYENRLFAVDNDDSDCIYEFKHSFGNKYHGYQNRQLSKDEIRNIKKRINVEANGL